MDITFKGTRYEPTPEIVADLTERVSALDRFLPKESDARAAVELERAVGGQNKGDIWRAEINVTYESVLYRAESTKTKLENAITTALRDVAREMARAHKKQQDLKRKGSGAIKSFLRGFGGK